VTRARYTARQLLTQIADPDARRVDRRHLTELIERAAGGARLDASTLEKAVARVLPPEQSAFARGYARLIEHTVLAVLNLERLSDQVFELARASYRTSLASYLGDRIACTPQDVASAEVEQLVNSACRDLLTHLGLQLSSAQLTSEDTNGIDQEPQDH
jgi:hypothetical protein